MSKHAAKEIHLFLALYNLKSACPDEAKVIYMC